jgi:hypothetical protein
LDPPPAPRTPSTGGPSGSWSPFPCRCGGGHSRDAPSIRCAGPGASSARSWRGVACGRTGLRFGR